MTTRKFNVGDKVVPTFAARRARVGWIRGITEDRGYIVFWLNVGEGDGWADEDLAKASGYVN